MSLLKNKQIIVGVTGGIAAYKSAELVRRLQDQGSSVQVVMTPAAMEFIAPLTFQALSGRPVRSTLFDPAAEAAMGHIELARWADAIIIAPCSANSLAKLAQGMADDLLSTLCLASDAPIALAPAMNRLMWSNPATQENLQRLQTRGISIFGPGQGHQACGETGAGRMLEAQELALLTEKLFRHGGLSGQRVLITAGPTREAIDPVRFISNHSSGKMGYALAAAALEAGAEVTLVTGPVQLDAPTGALRINVESALQMHQAVMEQIESATIFIGCAAVADYRLAIPETQKLKKTADHLKLDLIKNPDIIADVAALATPPFMVGFAAETEKLDENAKLKLKRKGIDMIAANWVGKTAESNDYRGFNSEENALEVFWPTGHRSLPLSDKNKLARKLIALMIEQFSKTQKTNNNDKTTAKNS